MSELALTRAHWRTGFGFILAALGAAIGLGNIWRFSYVVGDNGGGAFLVIYAATVLLVGLPMLIAELAVGRAAQRESLSAFAALGRSRAWRMAGVLGIVVSFVILTYYAVIAGWALKYFTVFASGLFPPHSGGAKDYFAKFIAAPIEPVLWQGAVLAATIGVVLAGIERGIERVNKILMPCLALVVIGLALHSLTLPQAERGLAYLFSPDWSVLARPQVYLAALGQAFFSLGVAMGVLVTYGSYLPQHHRLPIAGATIVLGDTLFAILAAVVIFPAVFSFGMSPDQGPGLAFVTLPEIFIRMNGGTAVGTAFFGLLVIAALTSSVALLEIPVATAMERCGLSRKRATLLVGGSAFILGIPSALGFGLLAPVRIAGQPILDAVDFLASSVLLPASGLLIALFVGWHWGQTSAIAASGLPHNWIGRLWRASVRYVAPAMIAAIASRAMGLI